MQQFCQNNEMKTAFEEIFLDNEIYTYQIKLFKDVNRIDVIGRLTTNLKKIEDEIVIFNEMEIYTKGLKERAILRVSRNNFLPSVYESNIETPSKRIKIIGKYQKSKVVARVISSQDETSFKIDLTDNYYDNASAFFLFRAFALGLLGHKQFYLINLNLGQKILVELKLTGEEITISDMVEFNCLGVKMNFRDYPQVPFQKFFYKKDKPNYLVKNIAGSQIIEIKKNGGIDGSF